MAQKLWLLVCSFFLLRFASAQYQVAGVITDNRNNPLEGVSITIKDTYNGSASDKTGSFSLQLTDTGRAILVFTLLGYKSQEKEIHIAGSGVHMKVRLSEEISELKAVVISAGVFEAADKKRATVLKSVDIVTTAGEQADITATLKTLPGAQQVGEQEGLFIRGGTGAETKVFIDGITVNNPFFSSVPGIAQRSRFSPLLFKGTVFSSGGYSAQYGQAISSVLILETLDLPSRSEINMIISSPQISFIAQKLNKIKTGSLGFTVNYSNLAPYFGVVKQKINYVKSPEILNGEFHLRQKVRGGMLKFYGYANTNIVAFNRPSLNFPSFPEQFRLQNKNIFTTATYNGRLNSSWNLYAGASYSYNKDRIKQFIGFADSAFTIFLPQLENSIIQSRMTLTKKISGLTKLYTGVEYQNMQDKIVAPDSIPKINVVDNYIALYTEADIYYTSKIVSRTGIRAEHSSLLKTTVVSPRISVAYKFTEKAQLSFAYGMFYQKPEAIYLFRKTTAGFTKATHYILNLQKVTQQQTLRLELFQKDYKSLLTYPAADPFSITNGGGGYAKGVEFFWRDKKSIKHLDYWFSYSYLDTKRKFLDYPVSVQPSFAGRHTATLVLKRFVTAISTQFSATYTYASGRPYYNPGSTAENFMQDKTMDYHNTGLQINHFAIIKKMNAVFILNINNVLGNKQVFSYRFSNDKINGSYAKEAVTPMAKRFVFIGMYLSIGADSRKQILD